MIPIRYEHLRERAKAGFKQLRHEQPTLRTGAGREPRNCEYDGEGSNPYVFWTEPQSRFDTASHLYVHYGTSEGDEATLALAQRIVAAMRGQGLMPVWDGSTHSSVILPPMINREPSARGKSYTDRLLGLMKELASVGAIHRLGSNDVSYMSYTLTRIAAKADDLAEAYAWLTTPGQGWTPEWWKRAGAEKARDIIESGDAYPTPEPHLGERSI